MMTMLQVTKQLQFCSKTCIDRATCFQSRTAICRVGVPAQTMFYGGWTHKKHMASTTDVMRCIHKPQAPRLVVRDIRENDQTINPASRRPVVLHSATDGILRAARHVKGPREEKTLLRLQSSILANHCIEKSAKRQLMRDQLVEGLGTLRC